MEPKNLKRQSEANGHRRKLIRKSTTKDTDEHGDQSLDERAEKSSDICGMIKRIILRNILCHEYLDVDIFTPNINLLQGKNGSGKSSIVAAVIAGLGGNLRSTDRGNSIKSLIKNGKSCATIQIYLKNSGSLGYKHHLYGDEVIVERRIPASGSSTYKIKSIDGTTISTKKEDLTRILDWYNFQVENPLLILSQERAKSFLSSTDPRELFKFFMTATFLQQLKEDIRTILSNLDCTNNLIQYKFESLSSLEKDVKEWEQKVQTINTLEDKRKQVASFRHEKAWAEIRDLEDSLKEKKKAMFSEESIVEKIQKSLDINAFKKKNLETQRKDINKELEDLATICDQNEKLRRNMNTELSEVKVKLRAEMSKKKSIEKDISERERDINILKKKLENDDDEVKNMWAVSNANLLSKRKDLELELSSLEDICKTQEVHFNHLQENHRIVQENYEHNRIEEKGIKSQLNSRKKELDSLRNNNTSLSIFGPYMPKIIDEIEIANSRGAFDSKPIGPLGRHIKIKDQRWAHIAELVIGGLMTSFHVINNKDLYTLVNIFKRILPYSERRPNIICSSLRDKVHDFTKYEVVSERYCSLWSQLEIDNMHVANTLLDQLSVESILLIPTGPEAANILKDCRRVPLNCRKAYTLYGDLYIPDPNYKVYSGMGDKEVRYFQVSVEDTIRDLELNISHTSKAVEDTIQELKEDQKRLRDLNIEIDKSKKKKKELEIRKSQIIQMIQDLLNQETPPPPDVIQLQEELKENEVLYAKLHEQATLIKMNLTEIRSILQDKQNLFDDSLKEGETIREQTLKFQTNLDTFSSQLLLAKREIATDVKKLEMMKEHIDSTKASVMELEEKLQNKMKITSSIHSERIVTKRSIKDIEKNLSTLEQALERAEETVGDPKTVVAKYKEKAKRYEITKSEITSQQGLIANYKQSMPSRKKLFNFNKKLSSLLLSSSFKTHIQKRNLEGLIKVNYEDETIEILMKKDSGRKDSASREKGLQSLKMMSGGERSFATVSYIISLWQLIFSPVRIMDEFDIFMDVVSKKQCIDMIVEAVEANNTNTQYVLVSPQEYNKESAILSVFRMPDPERSLNRINETQEED